MVQPFVILILQVWFANWFAMRARCKGRNALVWGIIGAAVAFFSSVIPAGVLLFFLGLLAHEFVAVPVWLVVSLGIAVPATCGWFVSSWLGKQFLPGDFPFTTATVFGSVLLDGYRELNSKKLFWIILALSVMFVLVYGSIGFDKTGLSMFFGLWHIDNEYMVRGSLAAKILYRGIFSTFVVPIWLAWIATILALISTATIFPDFVAGGSIDLVLSKPIGRIRLFFYKYIASLLFVLLQVTLFCVGVFICMGGRLGDWDWRIFLAIPIVVVFYSYLFSVCVFIGVWTRSALAALLLTLLLWVGLWGINQTEGLLNLFYTQMTIQIEDQDRQIASLTDRREELRQREDGGAAPALARVEAEIEDAQTERDKLETTADKLAPWHGSARTTQLILPKTSETIALLDRYLARDDDVNLMDLLSGNVARDAGGGLMSTDTSDDRQVMERMQEEYQARSLWYVLGTSILFEAVVLALACWIFVRRDY